ncbi:uncharacterized protein COLE_01118 [Cutaneotrichosporon oleaginosum]|uniref:uncharacterized protein n=1 Tax=Cutaneotrichosporon oleaginosum TaxID=879819 RepID=UPI001325CA7A|nr:hypothetical protein COLE_01118 [Cutaneotrichosporon oleaginosum]
MSDYAVPRPGGSLKFKGEDKKKKKKKTHAPDERARKEADVAAAETKRDREERARTPEDGARERERDDRRSASASASASASPAPAGGRRMTEAERRFEEVQRKRREERVKRNVHLTHKERVAQLNARLDSMSEHYDMPRVSPKGDEKTRADARLGRAKAGGTPQGVPLSCYVFALCDDVYVCVQKTDWGRGVWVLYEC